MNGDGWPDDSLLARLRAGTRETLLRLGTPTSYGARQRVIRQGEDSTYVLVVLTGCVKVVLHTEFGRDVLVSVQGAGDVVGEMAVLDHDSRSANVITCTPVRARLIKGAELAELIERNAEICLVIARTVSERLRFADRRRVEFVGCPAPQRVGRVLAELVQRHGGPTPDGWQLGVSLNQAEIASLAGVALSTVEKALKAMQGDGLLRRQYRRIVITDPVRLRQFGGLGDQNPY